MCDSAAGSLIETVTWSQKPKPYKLVKAQEEVTDVLLFSSVEFVSVSLLDCVVRGGIRRWLVQS